MMVVDVNGFALAIEDLALIIGAQRWQWIDHNRTSSLCNRNQFVAQRCLLGIEGNGLMQIPQFDLGQA